MTGIAQDYTPGFVDPVYADRGHTWVEEHEWFAYVGLAIAVLASRWEVWVLAVAGLIALSKV